MPAPPFAVHHLSAFDLLPSLRDESVDLIITDPPYESLERHRKIGTTTRLKKSAGSSNEWFETIPNSSFPELFAQFYRVLKQDRHFYLFCDQETMFVAKTVGETVGFRFWKPLVWDKVAIGMGYHYRCRYEFILFFEKGKRKLNSLSVPDILTCKRVHRGYPTEKPVEISSILISQSSDEGMLVLDPFCGSGSVGVAALEGGRKFLGCDLLPSAAELTATRLGSYCSTFL